MRSKALTEQILNSDRNESRAFSQEFVGEGAAFFGVCAEHGLEGIVSKRASSRYRSGRSKTWLKTKCFMESDLMLIGIDRDRKTGAERALLAKQEAHGFVYAGAAFLALGGADREALRGEGEGTGAGKANPDFDARPKGALGAT